MSGTEYDLTFLKNHGLMNDTSQGQISVHGRQVSFHYDRVNRLIYLRPSAEIPSDDIIATIKQQMLVDYIWIWRGDFLVVARLFGVPRMVRRRNDEPLIITEGHDGSSFSHNDLGRLFESSVSERDLVRDVFHLVRELLTTVKNIDKIHRFLYRFFTVVFLLRSGILSLDGEHTARSLARRLMLSSVGPDLAIIRMVEGDDLGLMTSSVEGFMLSDIMELIFDEPPPTEISLPPFMGSFLVKFIEKYDFSIDDDQSEGSLTLGFFEFLHELILAVTGISRKTGSYYTPDDLAHYITSQTISRWLQSLTGADVYDPLQIEALTDEERSAILSRLDRIRVLDPAVGGGSFLIAAAKWLLRVRRLLGDTRPEYTVRQEILANNLYGVDLLPSAVECCTLRLKLWAISGEPSEVGPSRVEVNVKVGNSLVGSTGPDDSIESENVIALDWHREFSDVFSEDHNGFDIVIGNPPYGNITSLAEREYVRRFYPWSVTNGRDGTWNSASLFLVRSRMLLNPDGHIGLLLPNSILRVRQFTKTRKFINSEFKLWEIVDNGSAFDGVTLETVTLFAGLNADAPNVRVITRRSDLPQWHSVPSRLFRDGGIMSLYYDELFDRIKRRGRTGVVKASRGRDIPHDHFAREPSVEFSVPYAAAGRSVGRYRFIPKHMWYADGWFETDTLMRRAFDEGFLVATKNLPYPRCTYKPPGIVHGGGVVRLQLNKTLNPFTVGLVLNSRLVRFLSLRYLTNYSELTTCLNTGIVEEIPMVVTDSHTYPTMFHVLKEVHARDGKVSSVARRLDRLADALVYELYLLDSTELHDSVASILESAETPDPHSLVHMLDVRSVRETLERVMNDPLVRIIENSPRMGYLR